MFPGESPPSSPLANRQYQKIPIIKDGNKIITIPIPKLVRQIGICKHIILCKEQLLTIR